MWGRSTVVPPGAPVARKCSVATVATWAVPSAEKTLRATEPIAAPEAFACTVPSVPAAMESRTSRWASHFTVAESAATAVLVAPVGSSTTGSVSRSVGTTRRVETLPNRRRTGPEPCTAAW